MPLVKRYWNKKSELKFKDYLWFLNENENKENKVVFDKALKDFQ